MYILYYWLLKRTIYMNRGFLFFLDVLRVLLCLELACTTVAPQHRYVTQHLKLSVTY